MKIKMTKTKTGSPNGFHVLEYLEGVEYDIPKDLARVFVEELKVAKPVVIEPFEPKKKRKE